MEERLVELFREYLPAWSWEEWQAAGASDKEDIVINVLADLGPDMSIEVDEAYDIFWDWAAGLTEADFRSNLDETISPEEKARVAAENEARMQKLAELEAERAARAKENIKRLNIREAEAAIAKGFIDKYNKYYRQSILSANSIRPAIDPETKELVFDIAEKKRILNSIRTNESLEEAVRIGAGNDALYHYTNLIPFMNILKTDTMKRPDDHEDYAICFTTDEGYRIYEFCFGLQFSRERLAADGYDLMLWDDAEEDNPEYADFYRDHPRAEDARTESEERIYNNIPNVSKYITDIHLHWSPEGKTLDQASDEYDNKDAFIDIAHGKQGDKLIGYEGPNDRMVLVPMSEFKAVLLSLRSKGVQIHTYGTRMRKMYVYDERGKVHKVPAYMRVPKVAEPALV